MHPDGQPDVRVVHGLAPRMIGMLDRLLADILSDRLKHLAERIHRFLRDAFCPSKHEDTRARRLWKSGIPFLSHGREIEKVNLNIFRLLLCSNIPKYFYKSPNPEKTR